MVLSDRDIKAHIKEKKLQVRSSLDLCYQPASLDVHLAPTILTFIRRRVKNAIIDLKKPVDSYMEYEVIEKAKGTIIHPHEFVLGVTSEWFGLPGNLLANVEGKSSLGRLGLVIHATAGFIDPGFAGHITLEMTNLTDMPMVLYQHMPIGQIRFSTLSSEAEHLYGEKLLKSKQYKNIFSEDPRPIASRYWKNLINN